MLAQEINRYMSMVDSVDNPTPTRRCYHIGDRFTVEITAVSVDLANKNDLMNIWKKCGYISEVLPSWLSVNTCYTDNAGNSWGIYNIAEKRGGTRNVINFDYIREATPENELELVAECIRLFCEGTGYTPDPSNPETSSTQEANPEPTGTQSIKFFWNGIKINGRKKLIRCHYSLDNRHDGRECVTIYARDYMGHLPGDMFPVENDTDSMTDYFETDRADVFPGHPLYPYARAAAVSAKIREIRRFLPRDLEKVGTWADRSEYYTHQAAYKQEQLAKLEMEQREFPKGQPTAADVEAVHTLNLAAETARIAAEKEQEQKEREAILAMRNAGRVYIEEVAAAHPIQEGDPVVTIQWSEHPAFYSWKENELKLSVAAAEIVLRHFDEQRAQQNAAEGHGGYDKTSFLIEYTGESGEPSTYEGRYDLGDNDGGMIAHIRAFADIYRNKRYPYHSEEEAAKIYAIADLLEAHTAAGRVVSVSVAPWLEEAIKARQKAAEEHAQDTLDMIDMLTDEQLAAAVLRSPKEHPDVARFFLQKLAIRDEGKALSVFRMWRAGSGLEALDEI